MFDLYVGATAFVFKIFRPNALDGSPVGMDTADMPQVVLWMTSMGHDSDPVQVSRVDIGTYRASRVFFVMPGEWSIRFSIRTGDLGAERDEVAVDFVF